MPQIKIPSQLRAQTGNLAAVKVEGKNVREALLNLVTKHAAIKDRIFDEQDNLRRYVNIYLGEEDIRFMDNLDTVLEPESEISLVPAIAGG